MNYGDMAAVRRSAQCHWPLHGPIAVFVLILLLLVFLEFDITSFPFGEFTGLDGTGAIGNRRCDAFLLCTGRTGLWKQFVPYGFLHIWGSRGRSPINSIDSDFFLFVIAGFLFSSFYTLIL